LPECPCQISPFLPGVISWKKKKRCEGGTLGTSDKQTTQKIKSVLFFNKCSYSEKAVPAEKKEILALRKMQVCASVKTWFIENVCA
jgi:hypothetical protein